jgi:hypothetical protein
MTLGLLDLSIVTDRLLTLLDTTTQTSRLWGLTGTPPVNPGPSFGIVFTGLRPDDPAIRSGCQVSLYLFHVAPDKFNRNTFPAGGRPRQGAEQPLGLTLYYLLSAHAEGSYAHAQQAMSIAIKCLHDHSIITSATNPEQFTLTIEPESVEEIGRLWQSLSCPLRMSMVFRASVLFLDPETPVRPAVKLVLRPQVDAETFGAPPPLLVLTPVVTTAGLVTITATGFVAGTGFDAGSLAMRIGGHVFEPSTSTGTTEPGRFRVVNPSTLELRFPSVTPIQLKGKYLLHLWIDRDHPQAELWLEVP